MNPVPDLSYALACLLPRIAEESADREEIAESDLVQRLAAQTGQGVAEVASSLAVFRHHLQVLSILDERCLEQGSWAFVSFPASLMARSILSGLGTPGFRLLESGFWDGSEYRIDHQRSLIKHLEELRATLPAGLVPIRRVWVSWAWLAMDGSFLMVRREDPAQHRDGSRGEFVFPGGRVTMADLPVGAFPTISSRLDFFDPRARPDTAEAAKALEAALRRELREELGLPPSGFEEAPAGKIVDYHALEGAKSAYSATEYRIQPFRVALSDAGKTALLRSLASFPERFAWFTGEELAVGVNPMGDRAFVDAIRQGGLVLDANAYTFSIGSVASFKDPVDIPGVPSEAFSAGVTGRERHVHVDLDAREIDVLNWLAAARRGEPISDLAPGVSVAGPPGWVLVDDDELFSDLTALAAKLKDQDLCLLDFHGRAARMNVQSTFYSPSLISAAISDERRGKSYRLTVQRRALKSTLGVADSRALTISLPEILGNAVYALSRGDPGPALENMETVKRMQRDIRAFLDGVGLRLLIRQVDGVPELTPRDWQGSSTLTPRRTAP